MAKSQRFCIYCGGAGLSKEHIFADWLRDYIPREMTQHTAQFTLASPHKTDRTLERRTGDIHARTLRRVCISCNNGWMSRLQESAKPYLVPMIQGEKTPLDRKAQKIVAAWVAMTVMTADFLKEDMVSIPQGERDHLRQTLSTPRTWRMWIGRYSGKQAPQRFWHNVMALTDQKVEGAALYAPSPSNTQTSAIGLGDHLFIYVMSSEVARNLIRRWKFRNDLTSHLRQIFPAAAAKVVWPPDNTLTFAEAAFVADQFFNRLVRQARKAAVSTPPPDGL